MQTLSYPRIIERVKARLPEYTEMAASVPYEEKGILYSEILFMIACLDERTSQRILESGRARGQSTLLLARALPNTSIISIEFNKESVDVPVAEERLRDCKNVSLMYGDARKEIPELLKKGDAVVIDGPKMFRAIRLALKVLATGKATQAFVHDVHLGTPERRFLELFLPETLFSDRREIAQFTATLDARAVKFIPEPQRLENLKSEYGYGYTLACIPHIEKRSYAFTLAAAVCYDLMARIGRRLQFLFR